MHGTRHDQTRPLDSPANTLREQSIIQTKVVLLIALLAVARKFIVLDLREVDSSQLLALAAITLALGLAYWLMRERDDRLVQTALKQTE